MLLNFVLYTIVLMYRHRKKIKCGTAQEIEPPLLIHSFHEIFYFIIYEFLWRIRVVHHLAAKSSYYLNRSLHNRIEITFSI